MYLIGVEMCFPFETIYLDRELHVSMTDIGLILGIALLATLPMEVVGGALCDRWGRRPLLIVGICGGMTLYIGLGLTRQLWLVVVLFFVEAAFGWAQFVTASNAMVADLAPMERRADAYSIFRVALNTGITVGPLFAAPLISLDPTFHTTFLVGGGIVGIFLLMVVAVFRETRPATVPVTSIAATFTGYGRVLRDRRMLAFCLVALLPLFAFGQIWVTLPIMLGDLHGVTAQLWSVALVVYGAATAILQYPVVRGLRRVDQLRLMAVASACMGIGLGVAAFVAWPATLACVLVISVGVVLFAPISSTIVSTLAPPELRGRYMGAWTLVWMGGYALGPLIGGWLLDALGGRAAFAVNMAACLVGAALFVALQRAFAAAGAAERHGGLAPEEALAAELPPDELR